MIYSREIRYSASRPSAEAPEARSPRIVATSIRVPVRQGFPKRTAGSIEMPGKTSMLAPPALGKKLPQIQRCVVPLALSWKNNWRRRSDSNRCMEVLQTSPLTTWVRRPALDLRRDRTQSIITRAKGHQLSIRSRHWFSFDETDQIPVTPESGFQAGFWG